MSQKLFIALPVYGSMPCASVASLVHLASTRPRDFTIRTRTHDSLIPRARNHLTADFLESDSERMLFLDADLIFTPRDVARIASHDVDVVGGFYPIKSPTLQTRWCVNGLPGTIGAIPDARGLAPVSYVGTGFMCIHRRVFEKMRDDGIAPEYHSDYEPHRNEHDYWSIGVHEYPADKAQGRAQRRYLSEDWMFCQRWLDLGGEVFGDCAVILRHIGEAVWPLPGQDTGMHAMGEVPSPDSAPESGQINRIPPVADERVER